MPFAIENWQQIQAIEGRAATQDDVNRCDAVFATGVGQSQAVTTNRLPALAIQTMDDGKTVEVVIVQIEKQVGGELTLVGYVLPSGRNGVGTLPEFNIKAYAD